jgi:hypothetical protein
MIVALAGRRIDKPYTKTPAFPFSNIEKVSAELNNFFNENNVTHLVSSGACGADLLGLEVAIKLKISCYLILPFEKEIFVSKSVSDCFKNEMWEAVFNKIYTSLEEQQKITILSISPEDEDKYQKTNKAILNKVESLSASLKKTEEYLSSNLKPQKIALILWEGKPKAKEIDTTDYTENLLESAKEMGFETEVINTLH